MSIGFIASWRPDDDREGGGGLEMVQRRPAASIGSDAVVGGGVSDGDRGGYWKRGGNVGVKVPVTIL